MILGAALVVFFALQYGVFPRMGGGWAAGFPLEAMEKRLTRLQQVARQKPLAVQAAEAAARDLTEAEKGLLRAATPAQASAEMQQIMKSLLTAQGINLQGSEFGAVRTLGADYAQVPLAVNFHCGIEQWINLMAAIRNAPQVLSSQEVRITQGDPKNKMVQVRMVVAGYIPAALLGPKGAGG